MEIVLRERSEAHVRIYFERTRDEQIQRMCPQRAQTVEEALRDYRHSLQEGSGSFGRTVYVDERYVGDVWCYCIGDQDGPDAMLSFCLFEKELWGRGIGGKAVGLMLHEMRERFGVHTVGAFVYMENAGSIRVLEKNGFRLEEQFSEEGRESGYYQWEGKT